ncbi:MAG: PAS domain S-box protein, partial [Leptolyngbyaceae cyanobacterium bins.59]|nr:PAS domain S-box protein [Leptolyngbyaceae cyanobacterium bins.59]
MIRDNQDAPNSSFEFQERYSAKLNPQVPWVADSEGNITNFSDRWLELTGLTREQAMGTGWM